MKQPEYKEEVFLNTIIEALGSAIKKDSSEFDIIDWDDLETEWSEFIEKIYNHGILGGLAIAKKAWDKGLGRNEIYENEIYYSELLSDE